MWVCLWVEALADLSHPLKLQRRGVDKSSKTAISILIVSVCWLLLCVFSEYLFLVFNRIEQRSLKCYQGEKLVGKKRERWGWDDWSVSLYILARSKTISISDVAKAVLTDLSKTLMCSIIIFYKFNYILKILITNCLNFDNDNRLFLFPLFLFWKLIIISEHKNIEFKDITEHKCKSF